MDYSGLIYGKKKEKKKEENSSFFSIVLSRKQLKIFKSIHIRATK